MRKLLKLIYLPYFLFYFYFYFYFILLNLLTRTMIIKRRKKTSQGRSVRPGETQKMGLSELRWMKNIYNKKKWQEESTARITHQSEQ